MIKTTNQSTVNAKQSDNHKDGVKETLLLGTHKEQKDTSIAMKPIEDFTTNNICYEDDDDEDWEDDGLDDDDQSANFISRVVILIQNLVSRSYCWLSKVTRGYLLKGLLLVAYFAYVIKAITYKAKGEDFWRLICCTLLGIFLLTRFRLARLLKLIIVKLYGSHTISTRSWKCFNKARYFMRWVVYAFFMIIMFYIIYTSGIEDINRLKSIPGLIIVLVLCLLMSSNPHKINWHTIYVSLGLQFLCSLLFLKWSFGKDVLGWIQDRLDEFFANSKAGSVFLFGETYEDHFMVFGGLPIILIMGATISVLYYLGAMQLVVNAVGSFLCFVLDTDPVESTSVAAGIFLEGVIAILSLQPFLPKLTKSQLFVVLTSAFSSLGGAYLGFLVSMQVPVEYLFTGMMISAPATFTVCKLIYPETKKKKESKEKMKFEVETDNSLIETIQNGSTSMLPLLGNIIAIIFVFMSAISWVDHTCTWFGDRAGVENLTLSSIFSYVLYPISLAMGIETADCKLVAKLWGYRITSSNVVAFLQLIQMRANRVMLETYQSQTNFTGPVTYDGDDMTLEWWNQTLIGGTISVRSEAIVTYSLCGFSSILAVGITIGVFFTFLPQRKSWIAKVPIRALIAGNIANLMAGCFASFFY